MNSVNGPCVKRTQEQEGVTHTYLPMASLIFKAASNAETLSVTRLDERVSYSSAMNEAKAFYSVKYVMDMCIYFGVSFLVLVAFTLLPSFALVNMSHFMVVSCYFTVNNITAP